MVINYRSNVLLIIGTPPSLQFLIRTHPSCIGLQILSRWPPTQAPLWPIIFVNIFSPGDLTHIPTLWCPNFHHILSGDNRWSVLQSTNGSLPFDTGLLLIGFQWLRWETLFELASFQIWLEGFFFSRYIIRSGFLNRRGSCRELLLFVRRWRG